MLIENIQFLEVLTFHLVLFSLCDCYGLNICVPTNSSDEALMGRDLYIGPLEIIRSQGLELLRWGQCLHRKETW